MMFDEKSTTDFQHNGIRLKRKPCMNSRNVETTSSRYSSLWWILCILFCFRLPAPTSSFLHGPCHRGVNGNIRSSCSSITSSLHPRALTVSSSSDHRSQLDGAPDIVHLPHIDRVLCLSDLHTDHVDNLAWLANRTSITASNATTFSRTDLIVVAGDISHDVDRLEESLQLLLRTGASVFFVSGNHEAWLSSTELKEAPPSSSLAKLEKIYERCNDLGVLTGCTVVGGTHERSHPLWILPLASWYDGSLSVTGCEDLCRDFPKWPWVDFLRCQWPGFPPTNDSILKKIPRGLAGYFLEQNEERVIGPFQSAFAASSKHLQDQAGIMTVSHFLPNRQCLPDWKDVLRTQFDREEWLDHGGGGVSAKFALVAGTQQLDEQIRSSCRVTLVTKPGGCDVEDGRDKNDGGENSVVRQIHVFGHSHRPKDFELNDVRYIHNPLGKPREREIHMINPWVDFQLVWDTNIGEVVGDTVIRYWEEKGGGVEMLHHRMKKSKRKSRHHVHHSTSISDDGGSKIRTRIK